MLPGAYVHACRLWLARRALEEGFREDQTYWPLVETLAQVLDALGDREEYERVSAYLLEHDPGCPSVALINKRLGNGSSPSGTATSYKVSNASRKHQERARQRIDHLHEQAGKEAKRRKLTQDEVQKQANDSFGARVYHLQQPSWQSLGKLLLEAFEDAMEGSGSVNGIQSVCRANICITVDESVAASSPTESPETTVGDIVEADEELKNTTEGSTEPPSKKRKSSRKSSIEIVADQVSRSGWTASRSDNDENHDSGVATTSDTEDPMPVRRKSRRNEQRLKDEHAAAVKHAREKDLGYRLRSFVLSEPTKVTENQRNDSKQGKLTWASRHIAELIDSRFRIFDTDKRELAVVDAFDLRVRKSQSDASVRTKKTTTKPQPVSPASSTNIPTAEKLTTAAVIGFISSFKDLSNECSSAWSLLDVIQAYLNQSGCWPQVQFAPNGGLSDIQTYLLWLQRAINGELEAEIGSFAAPAHSTVAVDSTRTHSASIRSLNISARLLLLELRYDLLLRELNSRDKRPSRNKFKADTELLIGITQGVMFDATLAEDDNEDNECIADSGNKASRDEMIRISWLLGRMHERTGDARAAQSYYSKCREELECSSTEGNAVGSVFLPNQQFDQHIAINVLDQKLSELRFSDVYQEANELFEQSRFDDVVSTALEYIFPANQTPRLIDLLDEFQPEEPEGSTISKQKLFPIIMTSVEQSDKFTHDDAVVLVLTMLYHLISLLDILNLSSTNASRGPTDDDARAQAFVVITLLLKQLITMQDVPDTTEKSSQLLLHACCLQLMDHRVLLMFESPSDAISDIWALLSPTQSKVCNNELLFSSLDAMCGLLYNLRSLSAQEVGDLYSRTPVHSSKKEQARREDIRVLVMESLHYLSAAAESDNSVYLSLAAEKREALMLLCVAIMKDEEMAITKGSKLAVAQQIFGDSAILLVHLFATSLDLEEPKSNDRHQSLVGLVHFLHERMGSHGLCGLGYAGHKSNPVFLETCVSLLHEIAKTTIKGPKSRPDDNERTGHVSDGDDSDGISELEHELVQLYRCLYDVQIISGSSDHKTGHSFADGPPSPEKSLRLADFAIPILLDNRPKTNGQKKENMKLLNALQEALAHTQHLRAELSWRGPSPELNAFVDPDGLLLGSQDALDTPPICDTRTQTNDGEGSAHLSHLWYLLGENYLLGRVRRRNNLAELEELERHVRERVTFLLEDVLVCHPKRIESWVLLGETMKEYYHVVTDACALLFTRHQRITALQSHCHGSSSPQSLLSTLKNGKLFEQIKKWKSAISNSNSTSNSNQDEPEDDKHQADDIGLVTYRYIALLAEFVRRAFEMAAHLGAQSLAEKMAIADKTSKGNDGNNDINDDNDEDELRDTAITCREEAGLVMYNFLQELSILKESRMDQFPADLYKRVADRALECFRGGLELCEQGDTDDMDEPRFRLYYMLGKVLKKKSWVERICGSETDAAFAMSTEILHCFHSAEAIRQEGNMGEHALVHAFYALQAARMELITTESTSKSALKLALEYYYEDEEDEEEEDKIEEDSIGEKCSPKSNTKDQTTAKNQDPKDAKESSEPITPGTRAAIETLLSEEVSVSNNISIVVARGWLMLNVIKALEAIPDEDRYFHPSRYALAHAVYWLSEYFTNEVRPLVEQTPDDVSTQQLVRAIEEHRSASTIEESISDPAARALKELTPVFDKKRPQVVAIWFSEYIPSAKKFEELNQRQIKYDHYRLKYWRYFVQLLTETEAYARLKEVGSWVLACKEDHDAIDLMLAIILKARGVVLRMRVRELLSRSSLATNEAGDEAIAERALKLLAKTYSYYADVLDAQTRLGRVESQSQLMLENAELPMVSLFVEYATALAPFVSLSESTRALLVVDAEFAVNVGVIKDALRRDELPPRIYDSEGREAWPAFLGASRAFCEERWPERTGGKTKSTKSRARVKAAPVPVAAPQPTSVAAPAPVSLPVPVAAPGAAPVPPMVVDLTDEK